MTYVFLDSQLFFVSDFSRPIDLYRDRLMVPQNLRTGLDVLISESAADGEQLEILIALMRVFIKEACSIAAICAEETNRQEIRGEDMRRALMYTSRTFFQNQTDDELNASVVAERACMADEEEEEDEEDQEGLGEEDEEEGGEEEEEKHEQFKTGKMSMRVEAVVQNWDLWNPDDPLQRILKRAVDAVGIDQRPTPPR